VAECRYSCQVNTNLFLTVCVLMIRSGAERGLYSHGEGRVPPTLSQPLFPFLPLPLALLRVVQQRLRVRGAAAPAPIQELPASSTAGAAGAGAFQSMDRINALERKLQLAEAELVSGIPSPPPAFVSASNVQGHVWSRHGPQMWKRVRIILSFLQFSHMLARVHSFFDRQARTQRENQQVISQLREDLAEERQNHRATRESLDKKCASEAEHQVCSDDRQSQPKPHSPFPSRSWQRVRGCRQDPSDRQAKLTGRPSRASAIPNHLSPAVGLWDRPTLSGCALSLPTASARLLPCAPT